MAIALIEAVLRGVHRKNPTEKLVLLILANYARETGLAWPSVETISYEAGISARQVRVHLANLRDAGLIQVEGNARGGCHVTTRYRLNVESCEAGEPSPDPSPKGGLGVGIGDGIPAENFRNSSGSNPLLGAPNGHNPEACFMVSGKKDEADCRVYAPNDEADCRVSRDIGVTSGVTSHDETLQSTVSNPAVQRIKPCSPAHETLQSTVSNPAASFSQAVRAVRSSAVIEAAVISAAVNFSGGVKGPTPTGSSSSNPISKDQTAKAEPPRRQMSRAEQIAYAKALSKPKGRVDGSYGRN